MTVVREGKMVLKEIRTRKFLFCYFICVISQKPMMITRIGKNNGSNGNKCKKTSYGDFECHKNDIPKYALAITLGKQPSLLINSKGEPVKKARFNINYVFIISGIHMIWAI